MKTAALLLGACLALSACATTTSLDRRISQDPSMYEALSPRHRDLVSRGQVEEGMSMDAVYLAWGRPHEKRQGSRSGRTSETWVYFGSEAVAVRTVGLGVGTGFGYRSGPFYDMGYGHDYLRRDYVAATVEFVRGRVVSWERARRR